MQANQPDPLPPSPSDGLRGNAPEDLLARALESQVSSPAPGAWTPPDPEQLAKLLPGYEVQKFIARGGMGAVYRGVQSSLGRVVAIKILPPALQNAEQNYAERFKQEARAMAQLNHPGIVAVHDCGELLDGTLYFVMEFVEGTDVARMVAAEGRLPSAHAMAITAHVCDALQYAHEHGVVHRDIKPANIMVGYDGRVKVADFGLAKTSVAGETGLTRSGMIMGTLHFMAPEALTLGSVVDHRADIYAVGVMLYQMLTGKLPQGLFEMPSLQVAGLDPRFDGIISHALRESREQRYQEIREMRLDLDGMMTQPVAKLEAQPQASSSPAALPTYARPQRSPHQPFRAPPLQGVARRAKSGAPLLGIAVAVLIAGAAWLGWHRFGAMPHSPVIDAKTALEAPQIATKEQPFTNTLGMKFVPVPSTQVLFCIHETRYGDYAAYAAESPNVDDTWKDQNAAGSTPETNAQSHPVMKVSWQDAQGFCVWLSKKEGKTYRLPTDHEWSMAAGIGSQEDESAGPAAKSGQIKGVYPWGEDYPPRSIVGNLAGSEFNTSDRPSNRDTIKGYHDAFVGTAPVMSFPANKLGIYDLSGNVWEWCEDWYDSKKEYRVFRGASWGDDNAPLLLSSYRHIGAPAMRSDSVGFRVVLADAVGSSPPSPSVAPATEPFTNTLGMKFVPVPGTKVLFCIHETRYRDYAAYAAENPVVDDLWKNQSVAGFMPETHTENDPVMKVSWQDAQGFCAWLSKKEGKTYRLPTDQEWSYAVGIGQEETRTEGVTPETVFKNQADFPWGKEWPPPKNAGNFSDSTRREKALDAKMGGNGVINEYTDGYATTAPVMSFNSNHLGLYDMSGNVWEWVQDWWNPAQQQRVLRGGCWDDPGPNILLSSYRAHNRPDFRHPAYGFRVALVAVSVAISVDSSPPSPSVAPATAAFTNTLGMKFVPVPGTKVLFCIHTTRVKDYAGYAAAVPGVNDSWKKQQRDGILISSKPDDPVVGVTWDDANAFCAWLSEKEGKTCRLPTDREWSIAVGIGAMERVTPSTTPESLNSKITEVFPWGNQWPPPQGAGNYGDTTYKEKFPMQQAIAGYTDGYATTSPVMSFAPNNVGLYDMGGNVWQWCEDWYDAAKVDHVLRGGSWGVFGRNGGLLSSGRAHAQPGYRLDSYGFRVVLKSVAPSSSKIESEPSAKATATQAAEGTPAVSKAAISAVPELAAIEQQFVKLQAERVTAPFETDVAKLNTSYLGGIDRAMAQEKAAGHLETVLTLEAEKKRVADKQSMPGLKEEYTSKEPPPEELKKLRAIYRESYAKLEILRVSNLKALTGPLTLRLQALQSDLTKQKRIADAQAVMLYRQAKENLYRQAREQPFVNSLGMKFVPVPGTKVLFCIHDTRNIDYAAYLQVNSGVDAGWQKEAGPGKDQQPVANVGWNDAKAFCTWLSRKEGKTYRLATDHEWSVAVGIGGQEDENDSPESKNGKIPAVYPWGGDFPPGPKDGNYNIVGVDDGYARLAPVMQFKPNRLGLYDMGGNVWQFCEDRYNSKGEDRIMRGGAWSYGDPHDLLSSRRFHVHPEFRYIGNGFRVVLEVPGS